MKARPRGGDAAPRFFRAQRRHPLTGYVRGGVTALGAKKDFPVYLDETALLFDEIAVSAGKKGLQLALRPDDYVRATGAKLAPLS